MRLELKQGINRCMIINDTYNSDINSLQIALNLMANQQQFKNEHLFFPTSYKAVVPSMNYISKLPIY